MFMTKVNEHAAVPESAFISEGLALYRRTLLEDVVPFWMRHGKDAEFGGIGNILDAAGRVLGHDKFMWSQGRALWTFSALYNRIDKKAEWLGFAEHIFRYLRTHGRDERGYWMYRLDKDGNVLDRDIGIYADGFVMSGMGEYYVATGDRRALQIAVETYKTTSDRLRTPGSYGTAPYAIPPGLKVHGATMLYSLFYYDLGEAIDRPDICQHGLELAWDNEYGGLMLGLDIDGKEPVYWQRHECKAWWVQVEALVATAYAYLHTGQPWCLDWHHKVQQWAFAHYPVPTGEWTQWVDREGRPTVSGGLPVKDPFHLPRALMYLIAVFEKIQASRADAGGNREQP